MPGNLAVGAFMLILPPSKVGDIVCVADIIGTGRELGLFGTTSIAPEDLMTNIGNNKIFGDSIQDFSALPVRRASTAPCRSRPASVRRTSSSA